MEFLIFAAMSIAIVHSLAPDHYIPFVAIGKSKKWDVRRILVFSGIAGTIHVLSSVVVGMLLILGIDLLGFAETIENLSPFLLIFIGLAYAILSVIRQHSHVHSTSAIMLLLILGLSPCIPLIPLMLAAKTHVELVGVVIPFSVATISTIVILTYLACKAFKPPEILHGREDLLAGLIVAAVGILTYLTGKNVRQVNQA